MVIGIIGAGLSGLAAGRLLARAGHEVTIYEKSRGYGGRMATRYVGDNHEIKLDHGLSHFTAQSDEFREFVAELIDQDLLQVWGENFSAYDGEKLLERTPNQPNQPLYTSTKGMNAIGKYLARWVDVRTDTKVGGLTYFGTNRSKKRSWMINLTSSEAIGADAVIIAVPARQAYGILSSCIDETNTLKIVRVIDEVSYSPSFSLMAGYNKLEVPEWEGIVCRNSLLSFISNESLKRNLDTASFVLQANAQFSRNHREENPDVVARKMVSEFVEITGGWAASPDWNQLHFWRYSQANEVIGSPFLELEDEDAPLALVGDYFEGNTVDHAYRSGYQLAKHWLEKW